MKKNLVPLLLAISVVISIYTLYLAVGPDRQTSSVVGIINPNRGSRDITRGFIEGLAEHGYREGENLTLLQYLSSAEMESAADDLLARQADMIFTVTTPATKKIKKTAEENGIPVVFAIYDPVASGIINSLTSTGGNLTGIQIRGCAPKAMDWLLEIVPDIRHVFVPIRFDTEAARLSLAEVSDICQKIGLRLTVAEVNDADELQAAMAAMPADTDAIFLLNSIFISTRAKEIADAGLERGVPTGAAIGKSDQGALVSFSPELYHIGKQASRLGHMSLQNGSAENIPGEESDCFLSINVHSASSLGLEIPNEKLLLADEIYR